LPFAIVRVAMPPVFGFGECVVFRAFVVAVHGVLLFSPCLKRKTLKTKGVAQSPRPETKQPKPSQQPKNVNRSTSALRASSLKVTK
jgi:hypothetical protein